MLFPSDFAPEIGELHEYGSYASWHPLLAHQPAYLNEFLARNYSKEVNLHFADMPEILPAWNLRLNVHQGCDVFLEDTTDKTGYAGLSDERALVRECMWLQ